MQNRTLLLSLMRITPVLFIFIMSISSFILNQLTFIYSIPFYEKNRILNFFFLEEQKFKLESNYKKKFLKFTVFSYIKR